MCHAGKTKASPTLERKVIRGRLGLRVGKQLGKGGTLWKIKCEWRSDKSGQNPVEQSTQREGCETGCGAQSELRSIQRGEREPEREGRKERWGVKATPFSEMPLKRI